MLIALFFFIRYFRIRRFGNGFLGQFFSWLITGNRMGRFLNWLLLFNYTATIIPVIDLNVNAMDLKWLQEKNKNLPAMFIIQSGGGKIFIAFSAASQLLFLCEFFVCLFFVLLIHWYIKVILLYFYSYLQNKPSKTFSQQATE
jgi:hypothetical protein